MKKFFLPKPFQGFSGKNQKIRKHYPFFNPKLQSGRDFQRHASGRVRTLKNLSRLTVEMFQFRQRRGSPLIDPYFKPHYFPNNLLF